MLVICTSVVLLNTVYIYLLLFQILFSLVASYMMVLYQLEEQSEIISLMAANKKRLIYYS